MIAASITIEADHLIRNRHFDTEFLRLIVGPCHQRYARNTGWKAQIVLDPSGGARLTTECAAIECQHRKSFGATIDSRSKPGGPGTYDDNIKQTVRVDRPHKAEATSKLGFARIVQKASIRTKHNRQLARVEVKTFDYSSSLWIHFGIERLMGMTITPEKTGEPKYIPVSRAANDDWPARTDLKQADSPKNQRSHDTLTEFCLSN
jgi:hypothetical protein